MIIVYILTYTNKPPTGMILGNLWYLFGFIMCIVWIYTLAKELVTCLEALGIIFHIPSAFLGLTILAWGNSMGDYFSNTSIARKGMGEMAIAGCYGGPVIEILIGLGLSLTYVCIKSYPQPYMIKFDISTLVSLIFLHIALFSTFIIVIYRKFHIDRDIGIFLLSLYGIYTIIQLILLLAT
jgi:sodium/potassium/calcium exchanger 6